MGLDMFLYKKSKSDKKVEEKVMYWRKANQVHKWFVDNVQNGVDNCAEHQVSLEQLSKLLETCETVLKSTWLVKGTIKNGSRLISDSNGKPVWKPILVPGSLLEDKTTAEKLLPTTEGFFFGGTEYDEYYWMDVGQTASKLRELLQSADLSDSVFYYQSSW